MPADRRSKISRIAKILPRREVRAFGSIEVYPKAVTFETQNPGESVFILARAHVIENLGWIFRSTIFSTLPIIALIFLDYFRLEFDFISDDIIALFLLAYYLSIVATIIMHLVSWYYDIYLVTSERIIHYDFNPLTSYKISEAEIENIQDVTQSTVGFLPSIFGYGDIIVRTASSRNKFVFKAVGHPSWFRDVIADLARLVRTREP